MSEEKGLSFKERLEQKATKLREVCRAESIMNEKWFQHCIPDEVYESEETEPWIKVKDVLVLLCEYTRQIQEIFEKEIPNWDSQFNRNQDYIAMKKEVILILKEEVLAVLECKKGV